LVDRVSQWNADVGFVLAHHASQLEATAIFNAIENSGQASLTGL